jgi:hypothetical protein
MYTQAFLNNGLMTGRLIGYSKSAYREQHPENEVYFNCNIFILGEGKIWYGDLDVTRDEETLKAIAGDLGKPLYILRESDGRFGNEELSDSEIIKRSVKRIEI